MTTDKSTLLQTIGEAANGLLFPSESDFPIEPFRYGDQKPTPEGLLERLGKDKSTEVEEMTLAALFEGLTSAPDDASDNEKASAARFANLLHVLEQNLKEIHVYRVGKVDIDLFVIGLDVMAEWVGITTKMVET